ncbi:hypothetical protein DW057_13045 [Lachnospira eligens]|uniref:HU family DNA-binding protein n=1 Tax=Lachnospira eligens TaxID=39485 RepID=A0A414DGT3_9FIRM|nr:hypothetical protein DW811_05265 [Lachnospira eligens]RHK50988.1 hypothetical protein DW057_13045 [Lachnospira eligens]RHK82896.1 hypothetical protein DW044_13900 [Lachnospira eligens]
MGGIKTLKEEIIKPGIVRRIVERVENENGLVISPETTDIILTAFLDTVVDILSKGNSIKLKGYMTIYPQLYKSKQIKNVSDQSIINIPERYKAKIKTGTKLNNACKNLTTEGE